MSSRKLSLVVAIMMALLFSCNKKTVPTIPSRESEPIIQKSTAKTEVIPDVDRGHMIFNNRCGRCHDLPKPDQYTAKRWDGILSSMIPKARLSEEQGIHLTAWIKSQTKQ